jgi:hypothetical protein
VGFLKARTFPQGSPASSGPAASSHGRADSPRSARVGHGLSSRVWWVVSWWFGGLPAIFCCKGGPRRGAWPAHAITGRVVSQLRSRFGFLLRVFCCFLFSFHSQSVCCINVTRLFVGLGARSVLLLFVVCVEM